MTNEEEIKALEMLRQEVLAVFDHYGSNTSARIGVLIGALISVTQNMETDEVARLVRDLHAIHQHATRQ